nr:hypothetical protein [Tanacetum cinerariifolium]
MEYQRWDTTVGTSYVVHPCGGTPEAGQQKLDIKVSMGMWWIHISQIKELRTMGRHKLIANISRFQRNNNKGGNKVGVENINNPVRFGVSIGDSVDKSSAMNLDDECLVFSEFSNSLFRRVKEFASLANIKIALANEGFADISIQYLGEYWILLVVFWLRNSDCSEYDEFEDDLLVVVEQPVQ